MHQRFTYNLLSAGRYGDWVSVKYIPSGQKPNIQPSINPQGNIVQGYHYEVEKKVETSQNQYHEIYTYCTVLSAKFLGLFFICR